MAHKRKVRKSGGAYIITIPKAICDLLNIKAGDSVDMSLTENGIEIKKIEGKDNER